jgi:hypothetical protein
MDFRVGLPNVGIKIVAHDDASRHHAFIAGYREGRGRCNPVRNLLNPIERGIWTMSFPAKLESSWRRSPARTALMGFVIPLGVFSALAGIVSGTASGIVTGILLLLGLGWMILMFFGKD